MKGTASPHIGLCGLGNPTEGNSPRWPPRVRGVFRPTLLKALEYGRRTVIVNARWESMVAFRAMGSDVADCTTVLYPVRSPGNPWRSPLSTLPVTRPCVSPRSPISFPPSLLLPNRNVKSATSRSESKQVASEYETQESLRCRHPPLV